LDFSFSNNEQNKNIIEFRAALTVVSAARARAGVSDAKKE
jgi:hypothetical protein